MSRVGSGRVWSGRVWSSGVWSGRVRSGRVWSSGVGSGRVGSGRVGSGRVGCGRVGSGRVGSGRVLVLRALAALAFRFPLSALKCVYFQLGYYSTLPTELALQVLIGCGQALVVLEEPVGLVLRAPAVVVSMSSLHRQLIPQTSISFQP